MVHDLKSGYHHVRMAPDAWSLLGFELHGQTYAFTCLPFGLSQTPWAFTQVLRSSQPAAARRWRMRLLYAFACAAREAAAACSASAAWCAPRLAQRLLYRPTRMSVLQQQWQ